MTERSPQSGGLAITWAGHSTVLLELDGVRLLTDPVVHDRVGPLRRIVPATDREVFEGLDAVLISHLHADHAHLRSLRTVARATPIIAPRGSARWLARHGFRVVEELGVGHDTSVGEVLLQATPAVHNPHRWHFGERRLWPIRVNVEPVGYVVRGSRSCYFAGDTDLFGGMSALHGSIDVAMLPVSGWGTTVGTGHLDPERAAQAAALIAPRVVVPIHWGTFALALGVRRSQDPAGPPRALAKLLADRAPAVDVRILRPGERMSLEHPDPPDGESPDLR